MNQMREVQPALFENMPPVVKVAAQPKESIRDFFLRFHKANPHVYDRLRDISIAMRRRGMQTWGSRAAWEILRYQGILTNGGDGYRLPNVCLPHYARLLMEQEPELEGFFRICKLRRE